ncbi:hypothetical protein MKK58_09670 [Methylobacterium sp. J-078]|uniref:hypothetical protein n=1 Tax=Methylobacterium sp. J-078 TaxID=2836657 RepID=UPI001FB93421|nr:hypothetical protein [Methylobacterium sp. J-078]MCJ2044794.1 hypothetical protein [Methylobacterium sp. J-078]
MPFIGVTRPRFRSVRVLPGFGLPGHPDPQHATMTDRAPRLTRSGPIHPAASDRAEPARH